MMGALRVLDGIYTGAVRCSDDDGHWMVPGDLSDLEVRRWRSPRPMYAKHPVLAVVCAGLKCVP